MLKNKSYRFQPSSFIFQILYFMQPDTTVSKLAREVNAKLLGKAASLNSETQENGPTDAQSSEQSSPTTISSEPEVQVLPLYSPEGSAIKFFCVHPSHRYVLSLVPISTGFQGQVIPDNSIMLFIAKVSVSKSTYISIGLLPFSWFAKVISNGIDSS